MDNTVDATVPVGPEAAAALADARNREAISRLVSRVLRPRSGPSPLAQAIADAKQEARANGLTDADIDAELAAYNAERRTSRAVDRSFSTLRPWWARHSRSTACQSGRCFMPRRRVSSCSPTRLTARSPRCWDGPKSARAISCERRGRILDILRGAAVWLKPVTRVTDCRDQKDDKYLELAFASGAEIIVSSDDDLTALHPWRGIDILRPADYLQRQKS